MESKPQRPSNVGPGRSSRSLDAGHCPQLHNNDGKLRPGFHDVSFGMFPLVLTILKGIITR